jgi:hypothetical protein
LEPDDVLDISVESDINVDLVVDEIIQREIQSAFSQVCRQKYNNPLGSRDHVSNESTEIIAGIDTTTNAVMQYVD